MRDKVSSGYPRLDEALHGGLVAGSVVVLCAPRSNEVTILMRNFLEASNEESLLICRTSTSAEGMLGKDSSVNAMVCSDKPPLHAKNLIPGQGIENLTEFNLAITDAITSLQPRRLAIDILSDILLRHKALQTRKWLNEFLEKLRSKRITTLVTLNPYMHASEEVQAVSDLFDGNLEIIEKNVGGESQKFLQIKWIHGLEAPEKELPLLELTPQRLESSKQNTTQVSLDRKRIAILPFLNISPDPKDEYFADGLTEELIARLSTVSELKVIARTSVMRFRGTTKSVGEIGKELKAGTILEGSVRKASNRLRVTAQLIDATSEEHLWVQSYDRQLEDIFSIQTEVAQNVTDALKTQLLDEERQRIAKKPTKDIGAYMLYLKGRYYWNERSKDSLDKAAKYFDAAKKKDPEFALAYSGLADCYIVLVDHAYLPPREGYPKAKQAATKALELDDTLAEAHTSLGAILDDDEWNWAAAEREFNKALKANPNYATAHHWYSIYLRHLGRLDEAIKESKIAEELDPLSPIIHSYVGALNFFDGQYDIAMKELEKSLELDPNFMPAHFYRCFIYLAKSMFEEALAEMHWVLRLVPSTLSYRAWAGAVYAISGRTEEAKRILQECEEASAHEHVYGLWLAIIHSKFGDKGHAFEWLEKAVEAREVTSFEAKLYPFLDAITSDPRFDELLKKTAATEWLPRDG